MRTGSASLYLMSLLLLGGCTSSEARSETAGTPEADLTTDAGESAGTTDAAQDASPAGSLDGAVRDTTDSSHWSFDDVALGEVPRAWKLEKTKPRKQDATWSVQSDPSAPSADRVLALTDTGDSRGSTFNLAWTDDVAFLDGTVEVKVKAGTGREDQGGGPIWRARDANNYYVARWNPLEDNFRLYYVKDSERVQLETARVNASSAEWHTITIRQQGDHIEALLDGEKLLETVDDTFTGAGGVGVWTKADAATSFDDFTVEGDDAGTG